MRGMMLMGVWREGRLTLPQADLFRGWTPYSGSFPKSGMTAAGGCWTADTSESPKGGGGYSACSLAAILETQEDYLTRHPGSTPSDWREYLSGYFLSAKACRGILLRAERRGRTLPPLLERALRRVAASGRGEAREGDDYVAFDEGRISHSLRVAGCDASEDGTGRGTPLVPVCAGTLTRQYAEQSGQDAEVPGLLVPVAYSITPDAPANTLHTAGLSVVIEAEPGAYQCHGSNVGPLGTLRAGNGNECGGVPFVVEGFSAHGAGAERAGPVGPLAASDDNGSNHVVVALQDCRAINKAQGGLGASGSGEMYTLDTTGAQGVGNALSAGGPAVFSETQGHSTYKDAGPLSPPVRVGSGLGIPSPPAVMYADADLVVRRLTPVECLRLQAMPDDHLDDLGLSDTAKYHLCGNGGVANVLEWVGRRLAEEVRNLEAPP